MPGFLIFFFHHYVCSNFTQHKECWLWEPSTHKRSCHLIEILICQAHFSMFSPLLWEFVQCVFIIFTQPSPTPLRFTLSFIQSHCCYFFLWFKAMEIKFCCPYILRCVVFWSLVDKTGATNRKLTLPLNYKQLFNWGEQILCLHFLPMLGFCLCWACEGFAYAVMATLPQSSVF